MLTNYNYAGFTPPLFKPMGRMSPSETEKTAEAFIHKASHPKDIFPCRDGFRHGFKIDHFVLYLEKSLRFPDY